MGIRESLIRALGGTLEEKGLPSAGGQNGSVAYQMVGSDHSRKSNFKDFAEDGYSQNAVVFRCVNEVAQGAASIPFKVKRNGEAFEEHPALALLERPNPLQASVEYFQALYSFLLISGNSYALKIKTGNVGVQELYLFRPDRINVLPSGNYMPKAYEYKVGGQVIATYDADPETGMSEVKHFKLWNPLDDYYGLSPIYAASADIDLHNLIARHNVNLLNNGARPTGAVVFNPKDAKSGLSVRLTDEQRRQVAEDLNSRFTGTKNSGRTMLLEGDFDWKEMGLSPKDMDFMNAKNISARDIALCFGVPAQLVGIPDAQTYANVQEARLALYEETIIPLARRVQSDLNEWLIPEFGEDIYFEYDIDEIPAIAERRRRTYENVVSGVREGIISRNEARERLGLPEIEGGDDVYINASLFPLGSPKNSIIEEDDSKSVQVDDMYESMIVSDRKALYPDGEEIDPNLPEAYAIGDEQKNCGNCAYLENENYCTIWDAKVRMNYVCAKWEAIDEEDKAETDVDTIPTEAMAKNASQGLEWRSEFKRGGTAVGVARANQLKSRERLSPSTVKRMHSYFSRHEVDKEAEGFRRGEKGFPSAGKIAWQLWGGDEGQSWAARKVVQFDAEKSLTDLYEYTLPQAEEKATPISAKIKEALKNKVKDHNDKHGDKKGKKVTQRMLEAVFRRGVGAYHTNPESVRPTVTSPDQWGLGRVNAFLLAVRTGKFKSGKFDLDLLPEGHPLSSKD